MKKYLCFIFVIFVSSLALLGNYNTLESYAISSGIEFVDLGDGVIKIGLIDYNDFVDELDINIISEFEVSDRVIIEGYSSRFKDYIVVDGFKVNIQMSVFEDSVVIGSPLINGSF